MPDNAEALRKRWEALLSAVIESNLSDAEYLLLLEVIESDARTAIGAKWEQRGNRK